MAERLDGAGLRAGRGRRSLACLGDGFSAQLPLLAHATILEGGREGGEGREAGGAVAAAGRSSGPLRDLRYRRRRGDGAAASRKRSCAAGGGPRGAWLLPPQLRRACQPPPGVPRATGLARPGPQGWGGGETGPRLASGGGFAPSHVRLCWVKSLSSPRLSQLRGCARPARGRRGCSWRGSACPGARWQVTGAPSGLAWGARRFVLPPAWAASLSPRGLQCLFYVRVQEGYSFFLLCDPQGLSRIFYSSGIHFFLSVLMRLTSFSSLFLLLFPKDICRQAGSRRPL